MDACSDPEIKEVVVMGGAQLGKSEALLNIIGYHRQRSLSDSDVAAYSGYGAVVQQRSNR